MSSYNDFENKEIYTKEIKKLKIKKMKALQACRYKRTHKASLSVEAALCFSLFIIAMAYDEYRQKSHGDCRSRMQGYLPVCLYI